MNVIVDHIRACSFLIVDGVLPGNEGRGYVLRRIIRRAIRHGKKLGVNDTFFHKLVGPLVAEMGEAYPELAKAQAHVEKVLAKEERRFAETLDQGMEILEGAIADLDGSELPGDVAFKLYDTYGFPVDLTADIARERNLTVDQDGFRAAMTAQRDRARAASKFGRSDNPRSRTDIETEFSGYENVKPRARSLLCIRSGESVDSLVAGDEGVVVLIRRHFMRKAVVRSGTPVY